MFTISYLIFTTVLQSAAEPFYGSETIYCISWHGIPQTRGWQVQNSNPILCAGAHVCTYTRAMHCSALKLARAAFHCKMDLCSSANRILWTGMANSQTTVIQNLLCVLRQIAFSLSLIEQARSCLLRTNLHPPVLLHSAGSLSSVIMAFREPYRKKT